MDDKRLPFFFQHEFNRLFIGVKIG